MNGLGLDGAKPKEEGKFDLMTATATASLNGHIDSTDTGNNNSSKRAWLDWRRLSRYLTIIRIVLEVAKLVFKFA